jgi:Domain of unknown function (DUF4157)
MTDQFASSSDIEELVENLFLEIGSPLDANIRSFFQRKFGFPFDNVRVHTSTTAAYANNLLGSHAFTAGAHIFLVMVYINRTSVAVSSYLLMN